MLLTIVRHGQSTNNADLPRVPDPSLTALGVEQARRTAQALRSAGLTVLLASPMRRAIETAAIIGETVHLPVRISPEFCEMGGLGSLPGLTRAEIEALYPGCELADTITESGWWSQAEEAIEQVFTRAQCAAHSLRATYGDDQAAHVALVTHGTFASLLINAYLGLTLDQGIRFTHDNGALSRLEFEPEFLRIRYLNRTDHLPAEMVT